MRHRQVAAHLGLAEDTVRGWIRRFRRRPAAVRRYSTVALVALADDPVMPEPAGTPLADAVSVVVVDFPCAHPTTVGKHVSERTAAEAQLLS